MWLGGDYHLTSPIKVPIRETLVGDGVAGGLLLPSLSSVKMSDGPASRTRSKVFAASAVGERVLAIRAKSHSTKVRSTGTGAKLANANGALSTKAHYAKTKSTKTKVTPSRSGNWCGSCPPTPLHMFKGRDFDGVECLRFTNEAENHRQFQYQDGLNVDTQPMGPEHSVCTRGLYFLTKEQSLHNRLYLRFGRREPIYWVRKVTLDPDEDVIFVEGTKYKAHKLTLSPRERYDWTQHPHYMDMPVWIVPHDMQTVTYVTSYVDAVIGKTEYLDAATISMLDQSKITDEKWQALLVRVERICNGHVFRIVRECGLNDRLFEMAYRKYWKECKDGILSMLCPVASIKEIAARVDKELSSSQ